MFFETTIMGNTADLQWSRRRSLTPSTKSVSHRGAFLKGVLFKECCIKAYYMKSWLEGRNWVGKCAQATGMTASLRILSSKADSNTWESFTRSGLKLESVHQESPRSDIFRKRATNPLLKQKHRQKHLTWAKEKNNWTVAQWSKVLFSDESTFSISFGNQGPTVWRKSGEAQNPCFLKSSEKCPVSDNLGCHVICWCWFTVFSEVHSQRSHLPGNFRALHAFFCWQALWRCWFHFPAGCGTCPHCQRYQKLVQWPWCYCAVLCCTVPANLPDLNPIENRWSIVKRKMRDTRRNNADDLMAAIKATCASITPQQCHKLITHQFITHALMQ